MVTARSCGGGEQRSQLWLILGNNLHPPHRDRNSGMPSAVTVMLATPEQTLFPDRDNVPA